MKSIDDLKREAEGLIRSEHEKILDRAARDKRDGPILDAFDRLAAGRPLASEASPPRRHTPILTLVPEKE